MKLGLLSRLGGKSKDQLWDNFLNRALADPNNDITSAILQAPEGIIYPVKTELSDPATTSRNIKGWASWLGADLVGIVRIEPSHPIIDDSLAASRDEENEPYSFAIVCAVGSLYDPNKAKGLGGQRAVQIGAFVNFFVGGYIRELGYAATIGGADRMAVAVAAGLGRAGKDGNLVVRGRKDYVHVTDVVRTDLPLAPDSTSG
jgi:hypothetical protein